MWDLQVSAVSFSLHLFPVQERCKDPYIHAQLTKSIWVLGIHRRSLQSAIKKGIILAPSHKQVLPIFPQDYSPEKIAAVEGWGGGEEEEHELHEVAAAGRVRGFRATLLAYSDEEDWKRRMMDPRYGRW
jgi:hypothetical protein